jgi:hypothetical protein
LDKDGTKKILHSVKLTFTEEQRKDTLRMLEMLKAGGFENINLVINPSGIFVENKK